MLAPLFRATLPLTLQPADEEVALKVMINMCGTDQTSAISDEFDAEIRLLSDEKRLPRHENIMVVYGSFIDTVAPGQLPGLVQMYI